MGDDKSGIEREEKLRVAILDEDYDGVNEYLNISDINKPSTHLGCEFQEISDDPTRIWADMSFYGFDDRTKKVYLLIFNLEIAQKCILMIEYSSILGIFIAMFRR